MNALRILAIIETFGHKQHLLTEHLLIGRYRVSAGNKLLPNLREFTVCGRMRQINQHVEQNVINMGMLVLFTEVSPMSASLKDLKIIIIEVPPHGRKNKN